MKSGVAAMILALIAIFSLVVQPGQAVTCGQVDAALVPCVSYLTGKEGSPSPSCCSGVELSKVCFCNFSNLRGCECMAQTTADRRTCCECVKAAANRYADLKDAAAQSLPTKCDVELLTPISRSVDCDKIALQWERDVAEGIIMFG